MRHTVPKFILTILLSSIVSLFLFSRISPVYSTTEQDLENEINKKNEELVKNKTTLSQIENRIKEISNSNYSLTEKINLLNAEITKLQTEIDNKNKEIEEKQKLLEIKKKIFDTVSAQLYMESRQSSTELLFSFDSLNNILQNLFIKKSAISILREDIERINGEFTSLSQIKEDLDKQKKDLDDSYALVQAEKEKLQNELNKQIAAKKSVSSQISSLTSSLSSLQMQLLYSRQGGTHVDPSQITVGGNYLGSLKTFMSQAPSGYFGVFSIGAATHRNGMSQWGAKARAEAGQSYQKILGDYYPSANLVTGYSEPANITIKGSGKSCFCQKYDSNGACESYDKYYNETVAFSTYMNRIYEMPASWSKEAVKAQTIASRTFAIYKVNTQGYIIPNESNQVSKDCDNDIRWRSVVEETQGMVLTMGGAPFSAQYAAVHGGWGNQIGWDIYDPSKPSDFLNTWDAKSEVSWIYKSWYRPDYDESTAVSSATCNRAPWLSPQEMADLVNAASRFQDLGATDKYADSRIVPIYDSCHSSGSPYSHAEMRDISSAKFTKVVSAIAIRSNGQTSEIIFKNEDGREVRIPGSYFKLAYNVRAPGYLRIPQSSFVHIDIQKK